VVVSDGIFNKDLQKQLVKKSNNKPNKAILVSFLSVRGLQAVLSRVVMLNMATNDGKNVLTTYFLEFKITLHCSL
jgi:hypothetical protein